MKRTADLFQRFFFSLFVCLIVLFTGCGEDVKEGQVTDVVVVEGNVAIPERVAGARIAFYDLYGTSHLPRIPFSRRIWEISVQRYSIPQRNIQLWPRVEQ